MSNLDDRINAIVNGSAEDLENQIDQLEDEEQKGFELVKVEYDNVPTHKEDQESDKYDDYVKVRNILHGVLDRGTAALEGSLMVAQDSQHPRAYEVSSSIMKNIADISKDLMTLHKEMEEEKSGPKVQNNTQINNYGTSKSTDNDVNNILDNLDED